jgi:hypothetical protein
MDFMNHRPGSFIQVNLQDSLKITNRASCFVTGEQVDHPKPFPERSSGFMENRAGSNRCLIVALFALIQLARTLNRIVRMTTAGTLKAIGPSLVKEKFNTSILGGESPLEIKEFELLRHKTSLKDIHMYTQYKS